MKLRNIPFSPPDMSEEEAKLASEAILSGWITTGPKTKEFEKKIAAYVGTPKAVCLSSATASMEMALRIPRKSSMPGSSPTASSGRSSTTTSIPPTVPFGMTMVIDDYGIF